MRHNYSYYDIRIGLGLNQTQLASLLGVSQGTVSKWEAGEVEPNPFQKALLEAFIMAQAGRSKPDAAQVGAVAIQLLGKHGVARALFHLLSEAYT